MPLSIRRPESEEYPVVYQAQIEQLPEGDVLYLLEKQAADLQYMFKNISDARAEESYEDGRWTIKELLQHMIDSERIMAFRALCISRGESQVLPGYDEDKYIDNSMANIRPLASMLEEYDLVRRSNLLMFRSYTSEMLDVSGIVNEHRLTLRALIHVIAAQEYYYMNMLQEKYSKHKK